MNNTNRRALSPNYRAVLTAAARADGTLYSEGIASEGTWRQLALADLIALRPQGTPLWTITDAGRAVLAAGAMPLSPAGAMP